MNIAKLIAKTDMPAELQPVAVVTLEAAKRKAKGLNWHKLKVRLFESKKLADKLSWESERLIDVDPALISKDIAPTRSVTAYGDHFDWDEKTHQPQPGTWLNKDPESAEYKRAVELTKDRYIDLHPRSGRFHRWWYKRNAGEGEAWARGVAVDMPRRPTVYLGDGVAVLHSGDAWELLAFRKLVGSFGIVTRVGYEIDNVWHFPKEAQGHYPIEGYELRAPLTWTVLPGKRKAYPAKQGKHQLQK